MGEQSRHVLSCFGVYSFMGLQDIENVRMEKLRRGLQRMSDVVMRGSSVMSAKVGTRQEGFLRI